MLGDRYRITDDDFSAVMPELINELRVVQFSMERMSRDEQLEMDEDELYGMSRILGRLVEDFNFINKNIGQSGAGGAVKKNSPPQRPIERRSFKTSTKAPAGNQ